MQKWYVEDYLTHKCVKNTGDRSQYFVEDDHDPHCAEGCVLVNLWVDWTVTEKHGIIEVWTSR